MHNRLTTRERILEVSLKLFNEQGYAATSLAGIAKEVGIAKGNLTYHFATKKDLAFELEQRARAQALERRSGGARGKRDASAPDHARPTRGLRLGRGVVVAAFAHT